MIKTTLIFDPSEVSSEDLSRIIPFIKDPNALDEIAEYAISKNKDHYCSLKKDIENFFKVELSIIRNPSISEETQLKFAKLPNSLLRAELAKQETLTMFVINILSKDNNYLVIHNLITHSTLSNSILNNLVFRIVNNELKLPTNNKNFIKTFLNHLNQKNSKKIQNWLKS